MRIIRSWSLLALQALIIMYSVPLFGSIGPFEWSVMNNKNCVYAAVVGATALLLAYTGCNNIFTFERWRVQEDPISDYLLYPKEDTDFSNAYVTIYCHGYGDTYQQVNRYVCGGNHYGDICDKNIILEPYATFNFSDAAKTVLPVYAEKSSMGQDDDIEKLRSVLLEIRPNCKGIIGFGCSRGAATWITLLEKHPEIKLDGLVLESSFGDMEGVVDTIVGRAQLSWSSMAHSKALDLFYSLFSRYQKDGPKPKSAIKAFPHDTPVLIVCSREDGLVKDESTIELYEELRKKGHSKAHLFIADYGKHSKIAAGQSGNAYQNVVHAFYKKYNLPHNKKYATAGQERFKACQPAIQETELIFS